MNPVNIKKQTLSSLSLQGGIQETPLYACNLSRRRSSMALLDIGKKGSRIYLRSTQLYVAKLFHTGPHWKQEHMMSIKQPLSQQRRSYYTEYFVLVTLVRDQISREESQNLNMELSIGAGTVLVPQTICAVMGQISDSGIIAPAS